jgi:hypothetical protein
VYSVTILCHADATSQKPTKMSTCGCNIVTFNVVVLDCELATLFGRVDEVVPNEFSSGIGHCFTFEACHENKPM